MKENNIEELCACLEGIASTFEAESSEYHSLRAAATALIFIQMHGLTPVFW